MTSTQTNVHFGADESARVELGCALPGWEFQGFDQVSVHVDGGRLTLFASPEQLEELAGSLLEVAESGREALAEAFRVEWGPRIARAGCVPEWRGAWALLNLIPPGWATNGLAPRCGHAVLADDLSARLARALA